MAKYAYPAIFVKEDTGYSVTFPDIDGCFSAGANLPEAIEMAADALCLVLYDKEECGEEIPPASNVKQVQAENGAEVSLVFCDTVEYRKFYDNRAIKKTLTIPNWLNTVAEKAGVNFSMVLQEALKAKLDLN